MAANQPMFEAPMAYEATQYSNGYSNPEFENEWEQETQYSNPELEDEWEHEAAHHSNGYSNPEFENEWEQAAQYSNPEFEDEWAQEVTQYSNPYANPEFENEWEQEAAYYSNPYANPEFEDEGEFFFKKAFRSIGRGIKAAAKRLAPIVAGKLTAMIPGVGLLAAPLAAKLTSSLVREGEMEAVQMEAEFFGNNEAEAEVANTEVAHEAALTEFLAAQAAEATNEAEAEAALGSALPITISIMGGRRALRRVTPVLTQANARLTKMLSQQGPAGKQLLRAVPTMQRRAIATLKAASRSGQPINNATAVKAMASAAHSVLNNPRMVQSAIARNAVLRQRTASPNPRRAAAGIRSNGRCPTCTAQARTAR